VWHLFVIRHPERDEFQNKLKEGGVETLIHYPIPPHLSGAYSNKGWSTGAFPVSEKLSKTVLSLPMGPHLTEQQIEKIVEKIYSLVN
jgi:dTDP-4-amino-4,6-dideoxygalactose transaminase